MPDPDARRPRRHRGCRTLTGLLLDHLPSDRSLGRARHCVKDTVIWSANDPADRIYFLERGRVAIQAIDPEGRDVILRLIEAQEPFGELCFCSEGSGRRDTVASPLMDSDIVEITLADFLSYLQNNRQALTALAITFCTRLSDAEHRLEVLSQRGAEERLGSLLLHLARTRAKPSAESVNRVMLHMTHDELARMAGMSRSHVTVTMKELRRRRLVQYQRNRPVVVDVSALAAYLERGE